MNVREGLVVAASEAAAETAVAENSKTAVADIRHIRKRQRLGYQYQSTKRGVIQNWKRRRIRGGGRNRLVSEVREGLFVWYSVVRHSVNTEMMCRFPKLVFVVKASLLYEE